MEPECVVCLQAYDEGEHVPRVLSCGHSLCESCALELPTHWGGSSGSKSSGKSGGGLIRCPECNHHTRLPLGGHLELPKNIELMRLIQSLQQPPTAFTSDGNILQEGDPVNANQLEDDVQKEQPHQIERLSAKGSSKVSLLRKELYVEPLVWILSQTAIKRRDIAILGFSIGDVCAASDKLVAQEVTLHSLSKGTAGTAVNSMGISYGKLVQSAWESLIPEARIEISQLMTLAHQCPAVAEVLGLWVSEEGELFLVSKVHVEGIRQAMSLFEQSGDAIGSSIRKAVGEERISCDGSKEGGSISRSSLRTLARVGVEICEILTELHLHGLIVGTLGPECFVLDHFGHIRLHIGGILSLRRRIWSKLSLLSSDSEVNTKCCDVQALSGSSETCKSNKSSKPFLEVPCSRQEYISPEVLDYIKKSSRRDEAEEKPTPISVTLDKYAEQTTVTPKADMWSLARLLLQLFSGSAPLGGVESSSAYRSIVGEKSFDPPDVQVGLGGGVLLLGQHKRLLGQLVKCFDHEPSERPEVNDVWCTLKELLDDQGLQLSMDWKASEPSLLGVSFQELIGEATDNFVRESSLGPQTAAEETTTNVQENQIIRAEMRTEALIGQKTGIDGDQCCFEVEILHGHHDTVSSITICGDCVISASFDKTLCVWSLKDNKLLQVLEGHEQRITAVAAHEPSKLCVSGDYGGQIYLWNLTTTRISGPMATWEEHHDWRYSGVASLTISTDEVLYSGSGDRIVKAWSIRDFQQIAAMEGHKGVVSALLVEGQILYSGSWDGTIRLWWRPDHTALVYLGGASTLHLGGIRALSSVAGLLFAAYDSGIIQVWRDEECVESFQAHKGVVSTLAHDQAWLYSGSWDGFVKAWRVDEVQNKSKHPVEKKCSEATVTALACKHDKLYVGVMHTIQVCSPLLHKSDGTENINDVLHLKVDIAPLHPLLLHEKEKGNPASENTQTPRQLTGQPRPYKSLNT